MSFVFAAVAISAVAAIFGGWSMWSGTDSKSPPHPPSSAGNTERFVGSSNCEECHAEQFQNYLQSGHARTFWSTRDFPLREQFDGLTFEDRERGKTFQYRANESGVDVSVPGVFGGDRFPLQFAFGSGEHAMTLMALTPDGSGTPVGIEHRVTWFSGMDRAALTPGQLGLKVQHEIEHFGRVIRGETLERCFGCHTTSCSIQDDTLVDLIPNVGCESCHSGGASHATLMADDPTATNAGFESRSWRTDKQISICAECHRGVNNIKPSQIRRDNAKIVRYQPVGLVQSKCYVKSQRLLCSTCHDPHQHAAKRSTRDYEQKCLQCHSADVSQAVQCSVSPSTGCISCHMPRVEIHPTISFHDHWIRIRGEADPPAIEEERE
ncbi:MAG: C cytochrome precursor [Planctomycetaceae bacterium]|nr:C cytochrome precursor [Planctomycetaceae bacterium]MBT6487956.1 C cytochrome precursor [Planctomycetaceae bacterium]MBT6495047.1 C cytochrome precursor [Planctomycetaceae bacterium]